MSKEIKKYSSDFKLKIVMKYLSGNFTIYQICSEYNIAKSTIHKFKENSSNIFSESSLSKEDKSPDNIAELKQQIRKFIYFYNYQRPHQSLNYKTPSQIYYNDESKRKRIRF